MHACDVLIAGGGPAGSSCAWGLRRSGLDVAVLDKQNFPRDKVCGGWITPRVLAGLEIDASEYSLGRVFQPITGFRVSCIGGRAVETSYGAPVSYGIRRREFDDYLLRRSGARLLLGTSLRSLTRSANEWIVNDEMRARTVIGAGGHFCPVARFAGATPAKEAPVVAQETEFEMDASQISACRIRGETPELYFCRDLKGYGWCFRKGNFLNIGLGRADPHRLSAHVAEFVRFLQSEGRISFEPPAMRGHAYLLYGASPRPAASDGMLLIGDAAGLANAQSGEGIWPAIESGLLAARSIEQRNLESYRELISSRRPSAAMSLSRYLPSRLIGLLGRNLLRTRWFVRQVVLDGWFLQPSTLSRA